ncbi:MAG: cyanophycin synthetase [Castellaniella sp.]|nr:cyanophycin synthetase [Castellaniella sp.]
MDNKSIEFLNMVYLRGPNIWAYRPVIEALVDIHDLEDYPSNVIPGFYERLSAWLPTLIEHRCSIGERGGFLQRVREGTWPAHILEHVTLELQSLAGMPGGLGRARETSLRGVYKVIVRAWHEPLTRETLYVARDLLMAAIEDRPFDVAGAVDRLKDLAESLSLGPSTACIVDAADDRDIPAIRLSDANLLQLGYGARQRRIWTAETSRTSAIAEGISRDKDLTRQLLQACGVPVPEGRLVADANEAWDAAQDIGLPVVVKPSDGNHGRGVFTCLSTREQIAAAFAVAVNEGSSVMVERFIEGDEHRLLVVGGRMVAAARGEAAMVVGDGVSTVLQLIETQLNSDPRRGRDEDHPLNVVRLDSAARLELDRQGLTGDSVPERGRAVMIQRSGNVSIDITDSVHPDVAEQVSLAARVVGLDIAGIDLVTRDISRPLDEQQGAIVEVNAGPGLLMHLKPAMGQSRPVGRAIIDDLFPAPEDGRIPVIGVTGSRGTAPVARLVAHLLQLTGKTVGLASTEGLFLGHQQVTAKDSSHWDSVRRVLLNRAVEYAVLENGGRVILGEGLAYDRCQIGVVTGIDPAMTWPEFHMETPEHLVRIFRTQVDVVLPGGAAVLNADDPLTVGLAPLSDGAVILYGLQPDGEALASHLAEGGRAVFERDGSVVLAEKGVEIPLVDLGDPAVSALRDDLASVLAALGAVWALGLGIEHIRVGLRTWVAQQGATSATMAV